MIKLREISLRNHKNTQKLSEWKASQSGVHVLNDIDHSKTLKCAFLGRIATFGHSPDGQCWMAIQAQLRSPHHMWPRWSAACPTHGNYKLPGLFGRGLSSRSLVFLRPNTSKHDSNPSQSPTSQFKIRFGENLTPKLNNIYHCIAITKGM